AAADRQDGGRRAPRVAARPPPPGGDPVTPKIAVVIPALNERENLALLLPALREVLEDLGVTSEIVVADGGSTDGSREAAARRGGWATCSTAPTRACWRCRCTTCRAAFGCTGARRSRASAPRRATSTSWRRCWSGPTPRAGGWSRCRFTTWRVALAAPTRGS